MKLKFGILTLVLIFVRGCDFYSTSLWFFENPSHETNPLPKIFGLGWLGLIISNIIIVSIIIYLFYYYSFKYTVEPMTTIPSKLTNYISKRYYGITKKFHWVFYKIPKNRRLFYAHLGYVTIRVLIIGSIMATVHNLFQFYNVSFYNSFREIVKRLLFVIYGIIIISTVYFVFRIWKKELECSKKGNLIEIN